MIIVVRFDRESAARLAIIERLLIDAPSTQAYRYYQQIWFATQPASERSDRNTSGSLCANLVRDLIRVGKVVLGGLIAAWRRCPGVVTSGRLGMMNVEKLIR